MFSSIECMDDFIAESDISLSYPASRNLLDRNVTLEITASTVSIENDWLASIPVFINTNAGIISTLYNKAKSGLEPDAEGIVDFLTYGYSVFGHTPLQDARYESAINDLVLELWHTRYKGYHLSASDSQLNGGMLKQLARLVRRNLRKECLSETNLLMILHNLKIDSHRWCVQRALQLLTDPDYVGNKPLD